MTQNTKPFMRCVSIRSRGIRGALPASTLHSLFDGDDGEQLRDSINLWAGTSMGAVVALAMAAGISTDRVLDVFRKDIDRVFAPKDWWSRWVPAGLHRASYDSAALEDALQALFGSIKVKLLPSDVCIHYVDLDSESEPAAPVCATRSTHGELRCWQLAMKAAATPTLFPSFRGSVDGSVACSSASGYALAHMTTKTRLGKIRILELGDGVAATQFAGEKLDWGAVKWAHGGILDLMSDMSQHATTQQVHAILGSNYQLLDGRLSSAAIALDNNKLVDNLALLGAEVGRSEKGDVVKWMR